MNTSDMMSLNVLIIARSARCIIITLKLNCRTRILKNIRFIKTFLVRIKINGAHFDMWTLWNPLAERSIGSYLPHFSYSHVDGNIHMEMVCRYCNIMRSIKENMRRFCQTHGFINLKTFVRMQHFPFVAANTLET